MRRIKIQIVGKAKQTYERYNPIPGPLRRGEIMNVDDPLIHPRGGGRKELGRKEKKLTTKVGLK